MSVSDLVALTRELLEIDSVTGHEAQFADWLEKRFSKLPADWLQARESHSVWLSSPRRSEVPLVAFFGHTDTVPPSGENPIRIENQELFGLGASDMKSGLAVMLALIELAQEQTLPCDVLFVFYEREEGPLSENGLTPLLKSHPEWKQIDLAICLEPTDNAIQLGCMGGIHAGLIVPGQAAHSARPWLGKNAVHEAAPLLADLLAREPVEVKFQDLVFKEVMSVTLAQGGTARNVIPSSFEMNLNYRYAPGKDEALARQEVEELVAGRAQIRWREQIPAGRVCLENPLLKAWRAQKTLQLEAKQAWTDVAQLTRFGVDALNCGPGDPKYAHQVDERIRVQALDECLDIMTCLLRTS